jgi:hypothetical protein
MCGKAEFGSDDGKGPKAVAKHGYGAESGASS